MGIWCAHFFMVASIVVLLVGVPFYRFQRPMGSAFTRFVQVIVASTRNHFSGVEVGHEKDLYEVKTAQSAIVGARKLTHTRQYRFVFVLLDNINFFYSLIFLGDVKFDGNGSNKTKLRLWIFGF